MRKRVLFLIIIVFISFIANKEIIAQSPLGCSGALTNCILDAKGWQDQRLEFTYGDCKLGVNFSYAKCTSGKFLINIWNIYAENPNNVPCTYPGTSYVNEVIKYVLLSSPNFFMYSDNENVHYVSVKTPSCGKFVFHPASGGFPPYSKFEYTSCTTWCCVTEYALTTKYGGVYIVSNIQYTSDATHSCSGTDCISYCSAQYIAPGSTITFAEYAPTNICDLSCYWSTLGNIADATNFMGTKNNQPVIFKANNTEIMRLLTNGNVGIGTSTPTTKLEVNGAVKASSFNTSGNIVLATGGKVGIGVASPTVPLDVSGAIKATSLNTIGNIVLATGGKIGIGVASPTVPLDVNGAVKATTLNTTGNIVLASGGNIGIGVASPTQKLEVNGNAIVTSLKVNDKLVVANSICTKDVIVQDPVCNWPDFVFESNYQKLSLNNLEQIIKQTGKLPGIPSKEDVANNGVSLVEMQAKLLQKIEELTLYMIELNKENQALKNEIHKLKK